MFLGGAGLADTILYCRHKIYPLGLPNWLGARADLHARPRSRSSSAARSRFLPRDTGADQGLGDSKRGELQGRFAFVMVTTLERLLLNSSMPGAGPRPGAMQLLVIERSLVSILGAFVAAIRGRLGLHRIRGVHLERGDEIRIEGERSSVILDGEMFEADDDRPIVLRPTAPVPFLRLAA